MEPDDGPVVSIKLTLGCGTLDEPVAERNRWIDLLEVWNLHWDMEPVDEPVRELNL